MKVLSCFLVLLSLATLARAETLPLLWVSPVVEEMSPTTLAIETETRDGSVVVLVEKAPVLTEADVRSAEIVAGDEPQLQVTLTESGADKFAKATETYLDRKLAILTRDHLLVAPLVKAVITGGSFTITGNFRDGEIDRLAAALNKK